MYFPVYNVENIFVYIHIIYSNVIANNQRNITIVNSYIGKSNTKFIKYSLDIILCKSLHNRKDYIGFISKDESLYPTSRPNDDRYQRLKGELTHFFKVCKKIHIESRVVVALPQFFYIFVHPIYI